MNLEDASGALRGLTFRLVRAVSGLLPGGRISAFGEGNGKIGAIGGGIPIAAYGFSAEVAERIAMRWLPALKRRRLPKRALELTAADLTGRQVEDWAVGDSPWKRAVEDDLARSLGLEPGEVVIDFPAKPAMFQLDLLVGRRDGRVQRLDMEGLEGLLDLPRVAKELYSTARVLRVFTFERREVSAEDVLERITRPAGSV